MAQPFEVTIESWEQFQQTFSDSKYKSWAFRGHADADWPLFSSLSRYFTSFNVHRDAWQEQENRILRIFKRKSHLFLDHIPDEDDSFEWLALMQHYGAPTRLLDFTWSPYVAAFFALERATKDVAIWALSPPRVNNTIRTITGQKINEGGIGPWVKGNYEKYFLPNDKKFVIIGDPYRMNRRLIAQSGTFLMPGILDMPIEEIVPQDAIRKFVLITSRLRKKAMAELYTMNINYATLFPGLDGLARSLAYELESHWAFDPTTMERRDGFLPE